MGTFTMAEIITTIATVNTAFMGYVTDLLTTITDNPILLIVCVLSILGSFLFMAIALLRRLGLRSR